ncbi:hypothetical protein GWI33_018714 [Rhynchophorus ferrugineus]|uniref:Uncharacterized protein n=1 Tax=Rhynchophorus ferrugineus TaxID=354439 RepID=A0A834M279_RHYFE|nr:hypothetical protein GWI33_018714 [Rhynchophorus ferrugineus]
MKFLAVVLFAILAVNSAYGGLLAGPSAIVAAPQAAVINPHGIVAAPGIIGAPGIVGVPAIVPAAPGVLALGTPALKLGHGAIIH